MTKKQPPRVYIIAGEPSGDLLGARLIDGLRQKLGQDVVIHGVGGAQMEQQGLTSLFPMTDIALMGLAEVLPHIFTIRRRIQQTVDDIIKKQPSVIVTIDSPGFCKRVVARVRQHSHRLIPCVHYVAPTVWAWRPGRAKKMAEMFDHLMTLFPFEPPYFTEHGLPTTFVGHSVLETGAGSGDAQKFRQVYQLHDKSPLILLLPGSRRGEIDRHLPIIRDTLAQIKHRWPYAAVVLPTLPHLSHDIAISTHNWPLPVIIVDDQSMKYDAFAAADLALAASGTVTLELAMAKVPTIVFYRVNPLTYMIGKKLVKIPHISLVNILARRAVLPEFIQHAAEPKAMADEMLKILGSADVKQHHRTAFDEILAMLKPAGGQLPSMAAAECVANVIRYGAGSVRNSVVSRQQITDAGGQSSDQGLPASLSTGQSNPLSAPKQTAP